MNRPNKEDYKVPLNKSSLIKWGEYSHAQDEYIDFLENKILARIENGISKKKEILEHNRMLERAISLLKEEGLCVNSVGLNIGEIKCDVNKNCDDCWMRALKGDEHDAGQIRT